MKEILLTSSVLILALLALRRLFRRTISRRMQYALWALVLVRLLVPLNVGTLAHNVLSAAEPVQAAVEKRLETPILYMQDGTERRPAQLANGNAPQGEPQSPPADAAQSAPADEYSLVTPTYRAVALSEALTYVWYAGMLIVGAWFLFTNLRFARALRKARTPYGVEGCRYPVYLVSALPSPCLFGVLRPAIYLNNAATASPETLRFVLAHEQTHARHLDPLWSLLRGLCLTVYWFDPLVWLAAVLSREDGELACDEGTLRTLGADERTAYGKALLSLVPVCAKPQNPLLGATTMTGGKRSLKERVTRIAENRQAKAVAVFAAVALAALVCAVSFTGSSRPLSAVCGDFWDAEATCTYVEERPDVDARYTPADGTVRLSEHLAHVRIGSAHPKKTVAVNPAWSTLYLTLPNADGSAAEHLTINFIREYDAPGSTEAVYSLNIGTRDAAKSYKVLSGQDEIDAFLAYLRGEASPEQISHPAFPNNLTEAERGVVDEFLHWAQALRAEDILNLRFQSGSGSRFLVDAELTALSAQLVPALNALTEAELYTQRGYGDSAYYTLTVNMRDGTQYTFLCGFDCVRLLHPTFEPGLSSSYPSDRPTLWIDSPALMACIDSLESSPAPLPDFETVAGHSDAASTTGYAAYDALLAEIGGLRRSGASDVQTDFSHDLLSVNDYYQTPGWLLRDLDGDGILELLLGADWGDGHSVIFNIYRLDGAKAVRVVDGWNRSRWYLCTDGSLANEGSSSAFESSYSYYRYTSGELQHLKTLLYLDDGSGSSPWRYSVTADQYVDSGDFRSVTEAEATAVMDKYTHETLAFTPFVV